jgi:hypothetical protein
MGQAKVKTFINTARVWDASPRWRDTLKRAFARKAPTPAPALVRAGRGRVAKVGTMVGSCLAGRTDFLDCF